MTGVAAIEIRRSNEGDLSSFWACLDAVARERRFLALTQAPPLEEARTFIEDARAHGMIQYVAIADGRVVGWCDVLPGQWAGLQHAARLGMGVLAEWRGRGIGKRLLAATIEAARLAGLRRVELDVFSSNHPAIALYEQCGFEREGVKRRARLIDGVFDDNIMMAIHFDGPAIQS